MPDPNLPKLLLSEDDGVGFGDSYCFFEVGGRKAVGS